MLLIFIVRIILQSVTKHSGQNVKTMYKSNVFTPHPLSMLRRNVWANNMLTKSATKPATLFRVGEGGRWSVADFYHTQLPQLILGYIYILKYLQSNFIVRFYSFEIHNLWHCYKVILNLKLSCYNLFWFTLDPPLEMVYYDQQFYTFHIQR